MQIASPSREQCDSDWCSAPGWGGGKWGESEMVQDSLWISTSKWINKISVLIR